MPRLPLDTPESHVGALVVGSGISGLWTALQLAERGVSVCLVTKQHLMDTNTSWAQGGIAAAMGSDDAPVLHAEDTHAAGAGLCDPLAVNVLTEEGPAQVRALRAAGVQFDLTPEGELDATLEAAHSRRRVVHAGGDATGLEIVRALGDRARAHPLIAIHEHTFVLDLWVQEGRARGAVVLGPDNQPRLIAAGAVVLAAGGMGRVWRHTTNPSTATGDAVALAYRAGAEIGDLEFMQFHPTALAIPGEDEAFLISEAVRGEGAILRNHAEEAFMARYHPSRELAPRDVVARAIAAEMAHDRREHVWLDVRHLSETLVHERFPTIVATCRSRGIELPRDLIPVAPAAHYTIGGARSDAMARTSLPGLYAVGEAADSGVHGANRLASNSLLEAVVFGHRAAEAIAAEAPTLEELAAPRELGQGFPPVGTADLDVAEIRREFQTLMWNNVGLLRDRAGLEAAGAWIADWRPRVEAASMGVCDRALWELRNLLQAGELVTRAALWREESRGTHFRTDFAAKDDSVWLKHFTQSLTILEPTSTR